jgi:transposase
MPAAFGGGRRRRRHSDEFKASAVAACRHPGVSMAAVAMARGINANLLRRWVRDGEMKSHVTGQDKDSGEAAAPPGATFVPVTIAPSTAATLDIRIELCRGPMTIIVTWPASAASECGGWIRELLR